jgi:aldehyde dehydrogenase (NAD+)
MSNASIQSLFEAQKQNRWPQAQTSASERIGRLQRLKRCIQENEAEIKKALWADFKKPEAEVEVSEIFIVVAELNLLLKNLKSWMKPRRYLTPLPLIGSLSQIQMEARGQVLVIAPWNYPFMLAMVPLISAIAAGNVVMLKPSERSPATSALMKKMIEATFPPNEVAVILGGVEQSQALLKLPFDHFFFTGSTHVGQIVARAAAEHLATTTLELGGKSPAIVLEDANISDTVQKIAWGKCVNGGQSCVAPDYVLVPNSLKNEFTEKLKSILSEIPQQQDIARMIDRPAFDRLQNLFNESQARNERVIVGGKLDAHDLFISPTAVETGFDSPLMREELFGPILPVIGYDDLDKTLEYIRSQPKPLALYCFGQRGSDKVLRQTTAGGTVLNHTMIHFGNHSVPLGGVGASGQGNYHGYAGFRALSHERSVMRQGPFTVTKFLFPPYDRPVVKFALWALKLLNK